MALQLVNIGGAPNDGTGDPLRSAFTKLNSNETELYNFLDRAIKNITKNSHGFVAGNVLYLDGSGILQKINDTNAQVPIGIVQTVIDANNFQLVESGYATGQSGLTAGTVYYVQNTGVLGTGVTPLKYFITDSTSSGYIIGGSGVGVGNFWALSGTSTLTGNATIVANGVFANFSGDGTGRLLTNFTLDGSNNSAGTFKYNQFIFSNNFNSVAGGNTFINISSAQAAISASSSSISNSISLDPSAGITITANTGLITSSNVSFGGLKYNANYSANFTARSLIDKGYADATYVSTSTGWLIGGNTLTGTSVFGDISAGGFTINFQTKAITRLSIDNAGNSSFTQGAQSSGWGKAILFTPGAHTGLTAATEFIDYDFALNRSKTWNDGTVALQRDVYFRGATYNKSTTSATFTNAYTVYIDPPLAGAGVSGSLNALGVSGGVSFFQTNGTSLVFKSFSSGGVQASGTRNIYLCAYANDLGMSLGANIGWTNFGDNTQGSLTVINGDTTSAFHFFAGASATPTPLQLYVYGASGKSGSLTNYERGKFGWNSTTLEIGTQAGGTGTLRDVSLIGTGVTLNQTAQSASWRTAFTITPGAHTSMTAGTEFPVNVFTGSTQTWAAGSSTLANQRYTWFKASTVNAGSGNTITNTYNVLTESPVNGSGTTTNLWALGVNGSQRIFGGPTTQPTLQIEGSGSTTGYSVRIFQSNGSSETFSLKDNGNVIHTQYSQSVTNTFFNISQVGHTGGTPTGLLFTGGAHTTLGAGAESNDVWFNLSRTVQFSTGALSTQRAFYIQPPAYGFSGASTVTDAVTVGIDGAPQAGSNATLTNTHALLISTRNIVGSGSATNSYGLTINAQTGATNNYSAQFLGGNVGVRASAPVSYFEIAGSYGDAITTLSANTTLDATHATVLVDATGANRTITLPTTSTTRRIYRIVKKDSSANTVTISTTAGGNKVISTQYAGFCVQYDGTSWFVIGSF